MPTQFLLLHAWLRATHRALVVRLNPDGDDDGDAGFTILEYVVAGAIAVVAVAAIATLIYNHFHDKAAQITGQ